MSGHDHNHHHGHSHGGGGGGHSHSCADEHDPADRGVDETLYKYIDLDNCRSFNCKTGMGAKEVIKVLGGTWDGEDARGRKLGRKRPWKPSFSPESVAARTVRRSIVTFC